MKTPFWLESIEIKDCCVRVKPKWWARPFETVKGKLWAYGLIDHPYKWVIDEMCEYCNGCREDY